VTRIGSAIAAAMLALAMVFGSPAEACISCNYVPEVTKTPVHPQVQRPQKNKAANQGQANRPAKKRVAKRPPPAKEVETKQEAKSDTAPAADETAAPEEATAAAAAADPVDPENRPTSTGSTALARTQALGGNEPEVEAAADEKAMCQKFSAAAGGTVTVPCE